MSSSAYDYDTDALSRVARNRTQVSTFNAKLGVALVTGRPRGVCIPLAMAFRKLGEFLANIAETPRAKGRAVEIRPYDERLLPPRFQPLGWAQQVNDTGVRPHGSTAEHPGIKVHQHKKGR